MIALEKKVGPEGPVIKGNACLRGALIGCLSWDTKEASDVIECLEVIVKRLTDLSMLRDNRCLTTYLQATAPLGGSGRHRRDLIELTPLASSPGPAADRA